MLNLNPYGRREVETLGTNKRVLKTTSTSYKKIFDFNFEMVPVM